MRCGKMLKDEVAEYCEDCAKRKSYITQGRSLWLHQKPVSDALYRFKYHNKRCYGLVFSEKLAEKYEKKLKEWKIGLIQFRFTGKGKEKEAIIRRKSWHVNWEREPGLRCVRIGC